MERDTGATDEGELEEGRGTQGHPLREVAGHRQDHHQPARGAQRLPAADGVRAAAPPSTTRARTRTSGVVILTGEGEQAFCSGGDQRIRGKEGYVGTDGVPRLNVLDLQKQIRTLPKPVVAMVAGYAIGGGHVLHVVCDLTIAADNARFGQTGPAVGSFDGGFGASYLARIVGQKKAREIWFLCRQYDAQAGAAHGPGQCRRAARRARGGDVQWCREMLAAEPARAAAASSRPSTPTLDGQAGLQELAGNATLLYYMTEEAQEGRDAYVRSARGLQEVPSPPVMCPRPRSRLLLARRACAPGCSPRARRR